MSASRRSSSRTKSMNMDKIPNSETIFDTSTENLDEHAPNLPQEIAFFVGARLESRLDVLRFRSVCQTWRSALPAPVRFPLRVSRPPGAAKKASYLIKEVTFYAANDLIFRFEEKAQGRRFSAFALAHKKPVYYGQNPELPWARHLSRFSFLCNAYHLQATFNVDAKNKIASEHTNVNKIVIVCSHGWADFNPNYPRMRDLKVVAHLQSTRKLAVLSLGEDQEVMSCNKWETGFCDVVFDDIVKYKGQLYGVEGSLGRAFVMDYESLLMTQVASPLFTLSDQGSAKKSRYKMHLAVVSGDLYMFVVLKGGNCVALYKLSFQLGMWLRADQDLPGHFFVQNELCNFAVSSDLHTPCDYGSNPRFFLSPDLTLVRLAVPEYQPLWSVIQTMYALRMEFVVTNLNCCLGTYI